MPDWLNVDQRVDHALGQFDAISKARIEQVDKMLDDKLNRFQEMLNGIKITVNVEMPIVKRAEPND